jgi:hypothetical protein
VVKHYRAGVSSSEAFSTLNLKRHLFKSHVQRQGVKQFSLDRLIRIDSAARWVSQTHRLTNWTPSVTVRNDLPRAALFFLTLDCRSYEVENGKFCIQLMLELYSSSFLLSSFVERIMGIVSELDGSSKTGNNLCDGRESLSYSVMIERTNTGDV